MTPPRKKSGPMQDPLWYKDAVIYELHVRAFNDSNGDGYGDFRGLTERLDYLQDLGINAIWLLPFYPSPLRDDGYDIANYNEIHPYYGNLRDFRLMLKEATARGIRIITELVINHTSDQHPWFQRARRAPAGSPERDYYVWSDSPDRYLDARIIFKDFEASNWTWDNEARAYYWHRFFSHQPDLNFENPRVRRAIFATLDYWLEMGISGMRLDAVPYLYEQEGTICENLPQTHAFLQELRRHVDRKFGDRMLLAEANQWPEDAAEYFGGGRSCHMCFHFPLMPRMFMAVQLEDRFPIIDILEQTPAIDPTCQWALFLRNHDELTLEMVTDEERDYMYRMYARERQARINLGIRRRLAPLLGNNRRKIELMNGLLFSLPGTPVIYYGDEIGMGDNIFLGDRNGVRTPMQWSADRNAGFSRANPQQLYLPVITDPEYRYEAINIETQRANPHSLLWWMKRLIAIRKQHKAFSRGTMEILTPENRKVLCFIRRHEDEIILVVANLSRLAQYLELDLSAYRGMQPIEIFGQTQFPTIGELPYFITLGPHSFYWFRLRPAEAPIEAGTTAGPLRALEVAGAWEQVFRSEHRNGLESALLEFLPSARWFGGKARRLKSALLRDTITIDANGIGKTILAIVDVEYTDGDPESYLMPLAFADGERAEQILRDQRPAAIASLRLLGRDGETRQEGVLHDAFIDRDFSASLLAAIGRRRRFKGSQGILHCQPTRHLQQILATPDLNLEPAAMKADQSNTSVIYGENLILKLYRRLESGINPDLELGRYLSDRRRFSHISPVLGSIEYKTDQEEPASCAILQSFIRNEGDAWSYTLDTLSHYFERVLADPRTSEADPPATADRLVALAGHVPDEQVSVLLGHWVDIARLIGQRTAELHVALASDGGPDSPYAAEPMTPHYQRSLYQSMRNALGQNFELLQRQLRSLPEEARRLARTVLERDKQLDEIFRRLLDKRLTARRIRIHGDYHLGQLLFTGRDFVILDFEGEPTRSLSERRIKRSPLRDVAGMIRSFHYASYSSMRRLVANGIVSDESSPRIEKWACYFYDWSLALFLCAYFEHAASGNFLPRGEDELEVLLEAYLAEKAIYELGYELNNRPDWTTIPLRGLTGLLKIGHEA